MRSDTVTTVLDAPRHEEFALMSDFERLPERATGSRELRREGGDYKVVNGLGEFYFHGPGMPDELFEAQHASLQREFARSSACSAGSPYGLVNCAPR